MDVLKEDKMIQENRDFTLSSLSESFPKTLRPLLHEIPTCHTSNEHSVGYQDFN